MPVTRHAWWRGERADVAMTEARTGDVVGSAAPPILARRRRAITHGVAVAVWLIHHPCLATACAT